MVGHHAAMLMTGKMNLKVSLFIVCSNILETNMLRRQMELKNKSSLAMRQRKRLHKKASNREKEEREQEKEETHGEKVK